MKCQRISEWVNILKHNFFSHHSIFIAYLGISHHAPQSHSLPSLPTLIACLICASQFAFYCYSKAPWLQTTWEEKCLWREVRVWSQNSNLDVGLKQKPGRIAFCSLTLHGLLILLSHVTQNICPEVVQSQWAVFLLTPTNNQQNVPTDLSRVQSDGDKCPIKFLFFQITPATVKLTKTPTSTPEWCVIKQLKILLLENHKECRCESIPYDFTNVTFKILLK